jgi:hypothetical protein
MARAFKALIDASMKSLRERTVGADLLVKMHSFTGLDVPITAQHFLTYRWDKTSVADGTLVTSIKYVMLPNTKPPSPQGHYFVGNEEPLINTVANWLAEQRL